MCKLVKLVVYALAALAPSLAAAQGTWPTRPIRLVVGFAAGGSTDIPARYVADKLGNLLGKRVAVENKGSAAGCGDARCWRSRAGRLHATALRISVDQHRATIAIRLQLGDLAPIC
jgi:tripartite-type tricarboxylate transporter receptor subunit TctC